MSEFLIRPLAEDADDKSVPAPSSDEHVVACAAQLFLRKGIADVKMVDIARASGVGVATVYRHFSTKARIAVLAATLLWRRFNAQILSLVESDEFLALNGLERMHVLLECYCTGYAAHGDFVAFLDEFDHLVLSEHLDKSELAAYGAGIDSFYIIFEDAYQLGRQDGSIVCDLDFRVFYQATAHALMGAAQKFVRGGVIPSDAASDGSAEIKCIVDMAVRSLRVAA